jgi:hypothetical protein
MIITVFWLFINIINILFNSLIISKSNHHLTNKKPHEYGYIFLLTNLEFIYLKKYTEVMFLRRKSLKNKRDLNYEELHK